MKKFRLGKIKYSLKAIKAKGGPSYFYFASSDHETASSLASVYSFIYYTNICWD